MFREISEKFLFLEFQDKVKENKDTRKSRKPRKIQIFLASLPPLSRKETGKNQFQPEKLEFFSEATPTREGEAALIGLLSTPRSPREL